MPFSICKVWRAIRRHPIIAPRHCRAHVPLHERRRRTIQHRWRRQSPTVEVAKQPWHALSNVEEFKAKQRVDCRSAVVDVNRQQVKVCVWGQIYARRLWRAMPFIVKYEVSNFVQWTKIKQCWYWRSSFLIALPQAGWSFVHWHLSRMVLPCRILLQIQIAYRNWAVFYFPY